MPTTTGTVNSLALQGDTALLAGDFASFGGVNRSRLAALDLASGLPTSWDPSPDFPVRGLALSGSGLYVGGSFTNIGGASHPRIARISYTTGQADAWDAQFAQGQFVSAIAVGKTTVFVGGQFQKIGGQNRTSLAELNATSGDATDWDPQPGGAINALLYSSNQIYVGGQFYGNEDFAREFHQLFFGIFGTPDPAQHEAITIKNTARALSGIRLDFGPNGYVLPAARYDPSLHDFHDLTILRTTIRGSTAQEKERS